MALQTAIAILDLHLLNLADRLICHIIVVEIGNDVEKPSRKHSVGS
jgi:hypothetical protein